MTIVQEATDAVVRAESSTHLLQIQPVMLRVLADEFDDTCNTVFPLLSTILASVSITESDVAPQLLTLNTV